MNETLAYIDDYFTGKLSTPDKNLFEKRCVDDPDFAAEVSFYLVSREQLKAELFRHKKQEFGNLYSELVAKNRPRSLVRKMAPYIIAIAASLLLFMTWITFFNPPSPDQLANTYIEEHWSTLSITMGGEQDSLQLGIAAYNNNEYEKAEDIFQALEQHEYLRPETSKYLGILYLKIDKNDRAIEQFDKLSGYTDLYANPGKFYGAVARMKRSTGDDIEVAKKLLHEVIDQQLPGYKEASLWINRL